MKIAKKMSAAALSLGLVVGMSGLAGAASGSISTTGPNSYNKVKHKSSVRVNVRNNNDLNVRNNNVQSASTGNARVTGNTNGGDAMTGAASNDNSFDASVSVDNSSSSTAALEAASSAGGGSNDGMIDTTGPNSTNVVTFDERTNVSVTNNNDVSVTNHNDQWASSGNATVSGNTNGGSAVTGDATNTNSSSVTLSVSN